MKSSLRKLTALVLTVMLLCCAAGANAQEAKATIGYVFYGKTDALGSVVYALVNRAAELWGIDVKWEIGGLDNDTQINSVQNLISGGVDGIVIIPLADAVTQKTSELCEAAGVYFSLCFRDISDEGIRAQVLANPYFVGMVDEEEYKAAKDIMSFVAEAGLTNVGVGYNSPTVPYEKFVTPGFNDGIAEYGLEKLAEFIASDSGDVNVSVSNIENFLMAYPDMQAVVMATASLGVGEAAVKLLQNTNVKLATRDMFSGMKEAFENGTLISASAGTAPDGLFALALCYNAVAQTPLADEYTHLKQGYIHLRSAEDCESFEKYFGDDLSNISDIYTDEFLNSLLKANNPELNGEGMQALMDLYSIDWINTQAAA